MEKLNTAIIGCGRMGKIRAQSVLNLEQNLLIAYDTNNETLSDFAAMFSSCQVTNDIDDIDWQNLNMVFICSPPSSHKIHLSYAIKYSIPFLIEKPISIDSEGISELSAEVNDKKIVNAVGYMNRYRPSIQYIKDLSFLGVSSYWINKMYQVSWWQNINESGGPLNEQATHLLDLNRYIMGEVEEVFATVDCAGNQFPTTIAINLKFTSGRIGNILYSCGANSKNIGIDLFTADERFVLSGWDFNLLQPPNTEFTILSSQDIFDLEAQAFLKAVINNNQKLILSDMNDALKTQLIVDAVNSSILTSAPVNIKNFRLSLI